MVLWQFMRTRMCGYGKKITETGTALHISCSCYLVKVVTVVKPCRKRNDPKGIVQSRVEEAVEFKVENHLLPLGLLSQGVYMHSSTSASGYHTSASER